MSVAIRTAVRLQDQDDVNVSLGAGVDEYALCWDNDTTKFVLRAITATGGLLATGATTGATEQAQAFTLGVVSPFLAPAADSTTAWQVRKADKTTAVVNVDTTNARVGIGTNAPVGVLHIANSLSSVSSLYVRGASDAGTYSTQRIVDFARSDGISLFYVDTTGAPYGAVVSIGKFTAAGGLAVLGSYNLDIGTGAFRFAASSAHQIAVASGMRFTENSGFYFHTFNNEWGGFLYLSTPASGSSSLGINTSSPASTIHGLLLSAATNAVTNVLTIGHDTTGTAAAGFGAGQLYALESSTTAAQSAARIRALWNDATHATRKADLVLSAYDAAGEREGLRIRGAGSAAAIGFLGAPPAARIAHVADPAGGGTVDAEARSAINSILATLETFGFHATS